METPWPEPKPSPTAELIWRRHPSPKGGLSRPSMDSTDAGPWVDGSAATISSWLQYRACWFALQASASKSGTRTAPRSRVCALAAREAERARIWLPQREANSKPQSFPQTETNICFWGGRRMGYKHQVSWRIGRASYRQNGRPRDLGNVGA